MTNSICSNSDLSVIAERMWEYPAYVKTGKGITPTLEVRSEGHYTVAKFVSPWTKEKTRMPNAAAKSRSALQSLCAKDKIRCVVYFLGYKAAMTPNNYNSYKEFTSLLLDLYQCRNMNHRGNDSTYGKKRHLTGFCPIRPSII